MSMSKQSITVVLFAAIFLTAASLINARSTQKKSGQKGAEQKKTEDVKRTAENAHRVEFDNKAFELRSPDGPDGEKPR
jgi:hypothetical protein